MFCCMESKFLWDSDDGFNMDSLDILHKPTKPKQGKKLNLFDDEYHDAVTLTQAVNYKDMYEAEVRRSKELEQRVELLTRKVQELEAELARVCGNKDNIGDIDDEKMKNARRQQYNGQKRSARPSKKNIGSSMTVPKVISEIPNTTLPEPEGRDTMASPSTDMASSLPSLLCADHGDVKAVACDISVRVNCLETDSSEKIEVHSSSAAEASSTDERSGAAKKKTTKKKVSLFDDSSEDDSDTLLQRRVDMTRFDNVALAATLDGSEDSIGQTGPDVDDEIRTQEKQRLDKQIRRQRQLNRRSQRARAAGVARRGATKSTGALLSGNSASQGPSSLPPSPSIEANLPGASAIEQGVTRDPVKKGPSLWSEDEDGWSSSSGEGNAEDDKSPPPVPLGGAPRQVDNSGIDFYPKAQYRLPVELEQQSEQIENMVLRWCCGKNLTAMITTLADISLAKGLSSNQLVECDLESPSNVRKAYLYVIHYVFAVLNAMACITSSSDLPPPTFIDECSLYFALTGKWRGSIIRTSSGEPLTKTH